MHDQRRQYIQALCILGVRGFRIDADMHMPNGAIRDFVPSEVAENAHLFAEIITIGGASSEDYKKFLDPYLQELPVTFGAYDLPLLHALRQAFAFGDPMEVATAGARMWFAE